LSLICFDSADVSSRGGTEASMILKTTRPPSAPAASPAAPTGRLNIWLTVAGVRAPPPARLTSPACATGALSCEAATIAISSPLSIRLTSACAF
jgi:hypothetical protein